MCVDKSPLTPLGEDLSVLNILYEILTAKYTNKILRNTDITEQKLAYRRWCVK